MGRPRLPLEGRRYGKLLVVSDTGKRQQNGVVWKCLCDCGSEIEVSGKNLNRNCTYSCGCYQRYSEAYRVRTHGRTYTPEFRMWNGAKSRAKSKGLDFNLVIDDIVIPELCPVLGVPLKVSTTGKADEYSPSLDRFDNNKGYVVGNIAVISYRANRIKVDATIEEVEKVLLYMKGEI